MPDTRKDSPSGSLHVGRRFNVIIGLFVAAIAGIFISTLLIFESQKSDALVIDLAGRQRMLHQRHMTEVLLASQGHAVELGPTRQLLRRTLAVLLEGGEAPLAIDTQELIALPAAPSPKIVETLLEQQRLMEAFVVRGDDLLQLSPNDPVHATRLQELLDMSDQLHHVSNQAVRLFDAHSASKLSSIIWLEIVVALFVGFVGVLLTRRVMEASQNLQAEIHERRQAEAALRESEEKLRSIIESSTDAILLKDLDGRYLVINAAGASFLGRPIAEIIGKRDDELFDPQSAEAIMAFDRQVMTSRTPRSTEELLSVEGRQRWFATSKVPYTSPEGRILGLIGVAHDITERKLTEQELFESREKLHRITDAVPGAVYQYTLAPSGEQRFMYFSRGVEELLNVTPEQALTEFSVVWALTHPDDVPSLRASIEQSAETLRPWLHEFRVLVDGKVKCLRGSSVPEPPRPDGVIVWNGILVDITERKRAEEELRKSRENTIAALRQSDTLKSALLSSVSHELRTPLAAIKAMVSSGFKRGTTAPLNVQGEFFDAITHEVDYLNRLVDNLLDMSRIEAGAMIPQREWQLLEEIVEGAIRRLGTDLKERPLEIKIDDDLPPVHVDAVEIQQVLVNLLENAIKYSPARSPIRLTATRVGESVEVRVCNAGPGVPPEDRTRIFERFYRAPTSGEGRVRGTGLGLAICRGIVEAHGGRIQCESVRGVETVMTFTIPLASQPATGLIDGQPCPTRSET